jgi:hypothetical protein
MILIMINYSCLRVRRQPQLNVMVRSVSDGFVIKMRDGKHLRCIQNNPRVQKLWDSAPHHAIVLKMEDVTFCS